MNLLDLMSSGDDLREKALDRLEGIIALYGSEDEDVQDEALARAITLCGKEWGGYKQGVEELAKRKEALANSPDDEFEALRLREEAEDPGAIIRAARERRSLLGKVDGERAAIVARYGSLEAAMRPSPIECIFIEAAAHLAEPGEEGEAPDPWASLAGWAVPWHPIPEEVVAAVTTACPLPVTVADARAEAITWEERQRERALLSDGPGSAALPTACEARHRLVVRLWARDLPVRHPAELEARLEYWTSLGGDDGTGYRVIADDIRRLNFVASVSAQGEATKEKARRLKAENPEWSLARIGKELGITRQAVHKHLRP